MRFMLYNIRYGTGDKTCRMPWSRMFRRTHRNMEALTGFMRGLNPDVIGLVEVDSGSYRFGRQCQAAYLASELGRYHVWRSKYAEGGWQQSLPVMNKQGNAFITRDTARAEKFHYFDQGVKKLVIELEIDGLTLFLVHLALTFRTRQTQLADLYSLIKETEGPYIVAGDFNALWGDQEIRLFLAAAGLNNADVTGMPSFPSWMPKRQLDFVLYSEGIRADRFWIPQVTYSDHLPLLFDFTLL